MKKTPKQQQHLDIDSEGRWFSPGYVIKFVSDFRQVGGFLQVML
jgi:hypothetical protein